MAEVRFVSKFRGLYARNNKSKLKKNMRCFPQCLGAGHTERAFCGCAMQVELVSSMFTSAELKSMVVIGGIRCSMEPLPLEVGHKIDKQDLEAFLAEHGFTAGYDSRAVASGQNAFLIFPGTRQGWNYLWNNNQGE
jgi:hypothetical protein